MERVLPSPELNKAYREFSRQRYPQLMASSRLMRETDAVQAIIREWEGLSPAERLTFLPAYPPPHPAPSTRSPRPPAIAPSTSRKSPTPRPPAKSHPQNRESSRNRIPKAPPAPAR
jgi:hypothetical protein